MEEVALSALEQVVWFATTLAHTGAPMEIGPVILLPLPLLVAPPCPPQVVWSDTTPAQTGADEAIGPVTPFEPCASVAVVPPAELDVPAVAPAPAEFEHVVL